MSGYKQQTSPLSDWRVADDPKTGRQYYYNRITRESTWIKVPLYSRIPCISLNRSSISSLWLQPAELCTDEERAEMERKQAELRQFFNDMERNILRKASSHYTSDDVFEEIVDIDDVTDVNMDYTDSGVMRNRGSIGGIRLVRTISSIDDDIMEMMKVRVTGEDMDRVSTLPSQEQQYVTDCKPSRVLDDMLDDCKSDCLDFVQQKKRRNSTGTIYIDSTMSKQDNKATIRCVCAVIRAHMIEAQMEGISPRRQFNTFRDENYENDVRAEDSKDWKDSNEWVPSLRRVVKFFENAFNRSKMESECIIMTLIYVERLVKVTKGRFCIRYDNWRPAVFSCMVLSSKVWDDLSMWNVDFSQISPVFNLQRINELELAVLEALDYEVKVTAGEYAKYYFHIRSMIARLGFHDKKSANFGSTVLPLNIEGARRLQLATESYEEAKLNQGVDRRGRCASIHVETPVKAMLSRMYSTGDNVSDLQRRVFVGLEQLTHTTHNTADGGVATGKYKRSKSKY